MACVNTLPQSQVSTDEFLPPPYETPHVFRQYNELIERVANIVAPVWPLKDYVAVNPYSGLSSKPFLRARDFLKVFSKCETLMPVDYFVQQYEQGQFDSADVQAAIEELNAAGLEIELSADEIIELMQADESTADSGRLQQKIRTISVHLEGYSDIDWSEVVRDEISKYCAAHYDEGQASWSSPWKHLSLYQAWKSAASIDRNMESLGLQGFREVVKSLPHTPEAAIVECLNRLNVPEPLWETVLLCQAFTIPGWMAWVKYQDTEKECVKSPDHDFEGLLAMRLAYDVALSECNAFQVSWGAMPQTQADSYRRFSSDSSDDTVLRYTLLRASELGFRSQLLGSFSDEPVTNTDEALAQMVFCIDVRSERIRRHLESLPGSIETFGFAGFFGMPIEYVGLGEKTGNSHVPALLKPQFKLHEGCTPDSDCNESSQIVEKQQQHNWQKLWKRFQMSAVGCFSFIESTGLLYGFKLLARAIGGGSQALSTQAAVSASTRPAVERLEQQGISIERQAELAESMLKGIGLTKGFARLVVFCGHASQTENNPLAAGLDCGACCGHSGEPNARMAATLLNHPEVREILASRGIAIPAETHFLAGLHNTTTDQITLFDLEQVPESHEADVAELSSCVAIAGEQTRKERMPSVQSSTESHLLSRAAEWSEVRPEWGLAGNAAFIVAPRALTKNANLDARSFMHSYDWKLDPEGAVLETIMTAPMIVAHWINMQYYASTVDQKHFGSGTKTVHNVVGQFGILSGNSGDLQTGLPWQSLHTGTDYQHLPMRLQAVIAAPRTAIERIIAKHDVVANLLHNGWLHLIAIEENVQYQYSQEGSWELLAGARN